MLLPGLISALIVTIPLFYRTDMMGSTLPSRSLARIGTTRIIVTIGPFR